MKDKAVSKKIEVAKMLGVSRAKGYKIVRELNEELTKKGYIVIAGKIPKKFFEETFCSSLSETPDNLAISLSLYLLSGDTCILPKPYAIEPVAPADTAAASRAAITLLTLFISISPL